MVAVRAFLAALIAVSIALVPATGGAVAPAMPVDISMTNHADAPCCPPDDCKGSIACALKCFNFADAVVPAVTVSALRPIEAALPNFVNDALHPHVSSPPTHPPPV